MASRVRTGRCGICGAAAPRGATLCVQCVAAVKRARHVNAVAPRLLPLPAAAPSRTRSALEVALRGAWRAREHSVLGLREHWGALLAFALFALAVCATGYMAVEELAGEQTRAAGAHGVPDAASAPLLLRSAPLDASRPATLGESRPEPLRRDPG